MADVPSPLSTKAHIRDQPARSSADPQSTSVKAPFVEQFQEQIPSSRWTVSRATKQTPVGDEIFSYVGTWAVEEPEVFPGIKGDTGLVLSKCRFISTPTFARLRADCQNLKLPTTPSPLFSQNPSTRRASPSLFNTRSSCKRDSNAEERTSSS